MTETTACASGCGRPAPGATLCHDCTGDLRRTLQLAAAIEPDLLDAIAKQLRHGTHGKSTGSEAPLPYDPAASDARRALALALGDAIYHLIRPAWPVADTSIRGMARWITQHMADVTGSPRAARDYAAIGDAVARCVRVLEPPPELHPAGDCESCGRRLLAEAGADDATCGCGWVTRGIAAARAQRAAAADVLGTATEISDALAKLGIRVSAGTIRMWASASRQRLVQRPGGTYAMSDVLALVSERDSRKARA